MTAGSLLADEGYEMGRMFGRANQNTPRNADEAKQAAVSFAATASGTLAGAVAGMASTRWRYAPWPCLAKSSYENDNWVSSQTAV